MAAKHGKGLDKEKANTAAYRPAAGWYLLSTFLITALRDSDMLVLATLRTMEKKHSKRIG